MPTLFMLKKLIVVLVLLLGYSAITAGYTIKDNLIKNGKFDAGQNSKGVPVGWTRSIQMPGAKAEVVMEKHRTGNCMRIKFFKPENMLQARVFQRFKLKPGKVYELKYEYKSGISGKFKADILMTGTGPIYRSIYNIPAKNWTSVKRLFLVPSWMKGAAAIYVQNRSTIPVWYKNISFKETNINPKKIKDYQPEVAIQPVNSDDQMIMPGTAQKEVVFLVRTKSSNSMKGQLYTEAYLMTGKNKYLKYVMKGDKISIPVARISDGTSTINVLLFDRKNKVLVATTNIKIEKIPVSMIKGNINLGKSAVFKDHTGKPFFPIGMYGLKMNSSVSDFSSLKNSGFNTVHCYSFEGGKLDSKRINGVKTFLDRAQSSRLKVICGIPRNLAERAGKANQLVNWLNNFKDHPAILCYYSDEMYSMRHTPVKTFKATRSALQKVSPKTKWIIYDTVESKLAPYIDGIMCGIGTASRSKLIKLRLGNNMPAFTVFGQRDYKAAKAPLEMKLRYDIFMPVALGARGVFYWWYPTLLWYNQEKELLQKRLYANIKILAEVAPAIVSDQKSQAWTKQIKASGAVRYCYGTLDNKTYIIAGVEKHGKCGTIKLQLPKNVKASELLGRTIKHSSKDCSLALKAGEVVIIKVEPSRIRSRN